MTKQAGVEGMLAGKGGVDVMVLFGWSDDGSVSEWKQASGVVVWR